MDFNPLNLFKQDSNTEKYKCGETVFAKGDAADLMYVVKNGEVDIAVNDTVLQTVHTGDIFGEMALIEPNPRSASAIARTDCELVPVDQKRFTFMIQHTPFFAVHVMKVLADRLRLTSSSVTGV